MTDIDIVALSVEIGLFLIMAGLVLGFIRLVAGPTYADRVVALDMMTVNIVAFCALYAIRAGSTAFLDVAMVLALVGFLATVALARFADRMMSRITLSTKPAVETSLAEAAINDPATKEDDQ